MQLHAIRLNSYTYSMVIISMPSYLSKIIKPENTALPITFIWQMFSYRKEACVSSLNVKTKIFPNICVRFKHF